MEQISVCSDSFREMSARVKLWLPFSRFSTGYEELADKSPIWPPDNYPSNPSSKKTHRISRTLRYNLCSPPRQSQDKRKKRNQSRSRVRTTLSRRRNTRSDPRRCPLQTPLVRDYRRATSFWSRTKRDSPNISANEYYRQVSETSGEHQWSLRTFLTFSWWQRRLFHGHSRWHSTDIRISLSSVNTLPTESP